MGRTWRDGQRTADVERKTWSYDIMIQGLSLHRQLLFFFCREPVWPSGKALRWQVDHVGSIPRFGCAFSSTVAACGHCLVTLSIKINEGCYRCPA